MVDLERQYRKYVEALNAQDHEAIDTLVADQLDFRVPGGIKVTTNTEARELNEMWLRAFPDATITVDELVVSGNLVFARGTSSGTHTGPLQTPIGEIAPTGRRVSQSWLEVTRWEGEIYVGGELIYDRMELAEQLGLMPTASSSS